MSDIPVLDPKALKTYTGADRITHFTEHLLEKAGSATPGNVFNCEFDSFDRRLKGIKTGEVVVITGKKKNGKTLFAESWLRSMMAKNPVAAKTLVFSYEIPTEDLLAKWMKEEHAPLYVPMSLKTSDFKWLYERCVEAKEKFDCKIVMIDHLHFLVDMAVHSNMSLNIGAVMRRLKQDIAIGLGLAVILIAHQSNLPKDEEASSDTIRDSSFIGQECDSCIVVGRRKNYTLKELSEIREQYGTSYFLDLERRNKVIQPECEGQPDKYSAGFAIVTIAMSRRTGVYEWSKTFQKEGDWLGEV